MGNAQPFSETEENYQATKMFRRISNDFGEGKEETVFLTQEFLNEFSNKNPLNDVRSNNPFCPISMKVSENWMVCCFVSPIMVLVSPTYLIDSYGEFTSKCHVLIQIGDSCESITVEDAILIKENQLCLAVLEKPVCKLGWMNISFIESHEELKKNSLKIVNFPQRTLKSERLRHIQKMREISTGEVIKSTKGFLVKRNDSSGSIICMSKGGTPSIVGIQVNEEQALFFDKKICDKIKKSIKQYMLTNEKEIMNKMISAGFKFENRGDKQKQNFYNFLQV